MSSEAWRPVLGFPGYEVSNLGRVRSRLYGDWRILRCRIGTHGYPRYALRTGAGDSRRTQDIYGHTLVMLAFIGPRPTGLVARHLNGRRTDNRLSNLCYGTFSENNLDAVAHGTHAQTRKTHCDRGHALGGDNTYSTRPGRACGKCRRVYMALYRLLAPEERGARRTAGLPVVDLDAYFADQAEETAA